MYEALVELAPSIGSGATHFYGSEKALQNVGVTKRCARGGVIEDAPHLSDLLLYAGHERLK